MGAAQRAGNNDTSTCFVLLASLLFNYFPDDSGGTVTQVHPVILALVQAHHEAHCHGWRRRHVLPQPQPRALQAIHVTSQATIAG